MKPGHPQICLYQPEIPQNTGNIGRLAAATACRLHIVRPVGFSLDDKNLRRSGLDYWPYLDLEIHNDFDKLIEQVDGPVCFFSKFAEKSYDQVPQDAKLLVFGRETSGFPDEFHERFKDSLYKIPMFHSSVRSLNLSNSVSIIVYDQLRQRGLF